MTHRRNAEHDSFQDTPETYTDGHIKMCAWSGCTAAGEYRAPKDRDLAEYHLFCLEHVRAYNASWDFHADLTIDEMEAEIRSSVTWDRPTWKIGVSSPRFYRSQTNIHDPFGLGAGTDFDAAAQKKAYEARPRGGRTAAENMALKTLDLTAPLTLEALRGRYKTLVKRHHPDANGGSREAERRMKIINEAYRTLRIALTGAA
tara:strand:+ start:839 stop:1444 length:606 start_codon:yes stop_codon:yes gene_type:complete